MISMHAVHVFTWSQTDQPNHRRMFPCAAGDSQVEDQDQETQPIKEIHHSRLRRGKIKTREQLYLPELGRGIRKNLCDYATLTGTTTH